MKIEKNLGRLDRIIRLCLAAVCIYVGGLERQLIGSDVINNTLLFFAAINLFSAPLGYCPLYTLASLNTRGSEKPKAEV